MDKKSNIIILESLFDTFLSKKGINKDYFNEYRRKHHSNSLIYVKNDPATWVSGAFLWDMTKEKYYFWDRTNDEWKDSLRIFLETE